MSYESPNPISTPSGPRPIDSAVKLAVDLIEQESGKFEPQKMPNEYAQAIHELVQAKVEQRAPEVQIETEKRENSESRQHHGRAQEEHAGEGADEGQRIQWVSGWARQRQRVKCLLRRHGHGLRRGARLISLHMHR